MRSCCANYFLSRPTTPKAVDVYLSEHDAQRALEDCLRDEPDWRGLPRVEEIEIELDHEHTSLN